MKNRKKHVLILGGSSDIGIEVVKNFLQLKWEVTAHFHKNKKRLEILKKSSKNLNFVQLDFIPHKYPNIEKLIIKKFSGRYDSVINLIGYVDNVGFQKTSFKNIWQSLAVNAIFPILIEKKLVKRMVSQKWGRIVNFSSTAGKNVSTVGGAHYTSAKAGILGFTRHLAKESAGYGITVNSVCPGLIDTEMVNSTISEEKKQEYANSFPIKRLGQVREVADLVGFLVSDKAAYITGASLDINGGDLMI